MASKENIATVHGTELSISKKHAIEICNAIRGKNLLKSKEFLKDVIAKKKAVPFRRYNMDVGHRKGKIGSGRYPVKASQVILNLLESLEVNAQNKGLDTGALYLKELVPNKASNVWRYGRQRRRKRKLTHLFMLAEEAVKKEKKAEKKEEKKAEKKEAPKVEKKTEQKETPKAEKKAEAPKEAKAEPKAVKKETKQEVKK